MKYILLSLFFTLSVMASPIRTTDKKNEMELEVMKRVVQEELEMNVDKMLAILKRNDLDFEHINNSINISVNGYRLIIIYDLKADRMRIICPILRVEDLQDGQMQKAMDANFHTALDARYAISDDVVWSIFVHPLSDLSEKLFQSALQQTLVAAATFGKEYSSGSLSFPASDSSNKDEVQEEKQ